jgi:hypothetical protein
MTTEDLHVVSLPAYSLIQRIVVRWAPLTASLSPAACLREGASAKAWEGGE